MPVRKAPQITAWSYSRWLMYEQCPFKLKCSAIDKIPIKQNAAMERGSEMHKQAELYVQGKLSRLPTTLKLFKDEFKKIRSLTKDKNYEVFTEQRWAFRKDWTPCEYFAKDCWVRIVVDLGVLNKKDGILSITDHKSGQARDDHKLQLDLYGTGGMAKFPGIQQVNTDMWYLDEGYINDEENTTVSWVPENHDKMIKAWDKRVKPMLSDKVFAPRPNNLCSWCDYSASKGGPCKF